jgi:hypothetical protein
MAQYYNNMVNNIVQYSVLRNIIARLGVPYDKRSAWINNQLHAAEIYLRKFYGRYRVVFTIQQTTSVQSNTIYVYLTHYIVLTCSSLESDGR